MPAIVGILGYKISISIPLNNLETGLLHVDNRSANTVNSGPQSLGSSERPRPMCPKYTRIAQMQ